MDEKVLTDLTDLVEAQRRELDSLRARVFELEADRRAAPCEAAPVACIEDARVSRRNLLGKAGAVAVAGVAGAVVAGGALTQPAAAAYGDPVRAGDLVDAPYRTSIRLYNYEDDAGFAVYDQGGLRPQPGYIAAYSRLRNSGKNMPAFWGQSEASNAFYGISANQVTIYGKSTGSNAVWGETTGSGQTGVVGKSGSGAGVAGVSSSAYGVYGISTSGNGVYGTSSGGIGVHGVSDAGAGVVGESNYNPGVLAHSSLSTGLDASGATYGATFGGVKAAIKLRPQSTAGKPKSGSHKKGELLCDSLGVLWFCTTDGSPGTWKQVRLV